MEGAELSDLRTSVRGSVRTSVQELARYRGDQSPVEGSPCAVVAPTDAEDAQRLVRWARRHRIPLVARGGGSSLDGESAARDGSVVADFSGWSRLLEVNTEELWARVEPGLVNRDLQGRLRPHGLFFPPNPGSWTVATIGGNVGTNASGPRSFRYGPTRAWLREVEAVLGTGERVRFGTRVAKRSAGPELVELFAGSEGTLGLATELTVRLAPLPARREGLVVPLPRGGSLSAMARRLRSERSTGLSAVEYIDRAAAAVLSEERALDWPSDAPLLLLEIEANDEGELRRHREAVERALSAVGASHAPTVFSDADELWTLRGASGVALDERMGRRVREDVAVPLGRIDDLVARLEEIGREAPAPFFLYGHLGEGSFHPNYAVPPGSPAAGTIRSKVLSAALDLGGTISAEHGIGVLKVDYLERELGSVALDLLDAVKRRCDPDGILNPGKLYPYRVPRGDAGSSPSPSGSGGSRAPDG